MKSRNYKILVQYDGTRYKGWQVQKSDENTIQGKLQSVLQSLAGEPVEVIGSGRTDAGVHASGQVANFHITEKALAAAVREGRLSIPMGKNMPLYNEELQIHKEDKLGYQEGLLVYLNHYLPEDIAVLSVKEVDERFHSRYQAVSKTYRYRIHSSPIPNVFERKYLYIYTDYPLDTIKMREAADLLIGTHDYAAFCGNRHMKKSTVRTIFRIEINELENGEIDIDYTGDGFLQNMVRILTGTLIEVGSGRRDAASIKELLQQKDRSLAGYTVPPQGLTLLKVEY